MSNRVPVFGDKRLKRWRDNFTASPFEVKLLPLVFIVLLAIPLSSIFIGGDKGKIIGYATMSGGGIFYTQVVIQSFKLVLEDQYLKNQIQFRLFIVITLLLIVLCDRWFSPPSFYIFHSPVQVAQQARFYRPIYNQIIPLSIAAILLIRLVPLTIKYYKLKREQKRLVTDRLN